jgi:mannan endo-1,4-beta-mannosidase
MKNLQLSFSIIVVSSILVTNVLAQKPVNSRESTRGDLRDEEWEDLFPSETMVPEKWKSQVNFIAWFLKQLDYAKVPVLWRPYHEMNGSWFWWGKKEGDAGYNSEITIILEKLPWVNMKDPEIHYSI